MWPNPIINQNKDIGIEARWEIGVNLGTLVEGCWQLSWFVIRTLNAMNFITNSFVNLGQRDSINKVFAFHADDPASHTTSQTLPGVIPEVRDWSNSKHCQVWHQNITSKQTNFVNYAEKIFLYETTCNHKCNKYFYKSNFCFFMFWSHTQWC